MKKFSLITTLAIFVLVALLSAIPGSAAFAAKPAMIKIKITNGTGAAIPFMLKNATGQPQFFTLKTGISEIKVLEGDYSFYAVLPCKVDAGNFHLNNTKVLEFFCHQGKAEVTLSQPIVPEAVIHYFSR